LMLADRHLYC